MSFRLAPFALLAASCLVLAPAPPAAEEPQSSRRAMTVEDLWEFDRLARPTLSPDGRWVAFTVTDYSMEENKANKDLWLVAADGSEPARRLTWNEGSDDRPCWSPDGKRLLFVSKRGEGPAQLYLLSLAGGEAEPLTDLPFAPLAPRWFPDGRRIAFLGQTWPDLDDDFEQVAERLEQRKKDETQARISESRLLRYWDHYLADGRRKHLFILDVETRKVRDLTPGSTRVLPFWSDDQTFDISPDGREIAFAANSTMPPLRRLDFNIFLLPVEGGEPTLLTADNPAADIGPRYAPDGRYLIYGRKRRPEIAPEFTRLARYDRSTGASTALASDWDGEPQGWTFSGDGRTLLFHGLERGRRHLFALPLAGGPVRRVHEGGTTRGADAGPGGLVVFTLESFTQPAEVMILRLDTGKTRALTRHNEELRSRLDLGRVRDVTFEGADGGKVQMFLLLPPGFDPARKWPLVQLLHGGPHGAWRDGFHYRWNAALFAAPGYVAAAVNFHGSDGFGQRFAESILGAHGDKPFTDIMKATDWLIAQGFVDPERMAAAGGSYGGYLASWILGHTDRFRALVNHAGVYDLLSQYASDWTWGRANNYGATPWEDPERIDRWSPSRFAEGFRTPTLILHGERDYRVPYTQGLALHGVLTAKGVPSRIVIFPKENHWILKPQAARLWWGEVHGWLARYLQP